MSLDEKQQSLIDDLNIIHDPHERLNAIVSRGHALKLDDAYKSEANLVPGCVSRVWLHGELVDGRTRFICDAESPMVKGLAALLCELYSDADPAEAAVIEPRVWEACGFTKMLSPTRLNGLANMRLRIQVMANQFITSNLSH
ncbi:MAG: SufE family protein [Prosthecobacter sp.]|uniref:SufE family protein n=1 Tax=Prosthecobacter sp. TaxID=1965333 RepID=UPI0025DD6913|nr:SufE family protein [Prosthecobacter sp.]MCF7784617.1 SufE family protein [Prosthecobacter sp.]